MADGNFIAPQIGQGAAYVFPQGPNAADTYIEQARRNQELGIRQQNLLKQQQLAGQKALQGQVGDLKPAAEFQPAIYGELQKIITEGSKLGSRAWDPTDPEGQKFQQAIAQISQVSVATNEIAKYKEDIRQKLGSAKEGEYTTESIQEAAAYLSESDPFKLVGTRPPALLKGAEPIDVLGELSKFKNDFLPTKTDETGAYSITSKRFSEPLAKDFVDTRFEEKGWQEWAKKVYGSVEEGKKASVDYLRTLNEGQESTARKLNIGYLNYQLSKGKEAKKDKQTYIREEVRKKIQDGWPSYLGYMAGASSPYGKIMDATVATGQMIGRIHDKNFESISDINEYLSNPSNRKIDGLAEFKEGKPIVIYQTVDGSWHKLPEDLNKINNILNTSPGLLRVDELELSEEPDYQYTPEEQKAIRKARENAVLESPSGSQRYTINGKSFTQDQIKKAADASGMTVDEYLKEINP